MLSSLYTDCFCGKRQRRIPIDFILHSNCVFVHSCFVLFLKTKDCSINHSGGLSLPTVAIQPELYIDLLPSTKTSGFLHNSREPHSKKLYQSIHGLHLQPECS